MSRTYVAWYEPVPARALVERQRQDDVHDGAVVLDVRL